jgi:hypothetical protein
VVLIKEDTKKLVETFPRVDVTAANSDNSGVFSPFLADGITWHGQFRCKPGQSNTLPYFRDRDELASATYYGDWTKAMAVLARSRQVHNQMWVNCWRICLFMVPFDTSIPRQTDVLFSALRSYREQSQWLHSFTPGSISWSCKGNC